MTPASTTPTNAELEILHVLWRRGPRTVRDVHDTIRKRRDIGYTTVLKAMQVMAEKGLATRDESERSHVYAAAIPEATVRKRLVADLVDRVFDGSAVGLAMHALSTRRASAAELKEIRRLLERLNRNEEQ